ncbi:hypothetical protein OIDMADRAFT_54146 [Oidiodendron maius Zn]|uniref:C3H1-type domain-containing protein n=1 Tax=Oidiodendron maius (strain Zn) TaxID=913774 RepID=A0A0C3HCR7_OIDMZ|nr:hypothetical protein OIDMADRAFT_54146 [Oidiodendron maius Zn]
MVVCKFWQQGSCRYGDRCRFDHPPLNQGLAIGNRFAALQGPDSSSTRNTGPDAAVRTSPYSLDKTAIITDLSSERPQWILSAYGPGRNAPAQLFGGPMREQSFEEMRLMHYMALASGNPQQAVQEADKLFQASEQQMQTVISNVDGAIDFIISAENEHPNRIDTCRASTSGPLSTSNPLNQGGGSAIPFSSTQGQNNPFGAPSQLTSTSIFSAPTATAQSVPFGQPSALGEKPNALGGGAPAFGAPSQLGAVGAFGRPSALGQKPNPFGASSNGALSSTSSGASAPFVSSAGAGNPFSQPQQQQAANPFGAPSGSGFSTSAQSAGQGPFSNASDRGPNPFTSANQFGASPAPFGTPAAGAANPFGQPSTKPLATSVNPFGNAPASAENQFGKSPTLSTTNPFSSMDTRQIGTPSQPLPNGNALIDPNGPLQHPSLEAYGTKDHNGRLTMFKGMRVAYKGDEAGFNTKDGNWRKIWFPQGAPAPYKDTEMGDSNYDDNIEAAYMRLQQSRSFPGGVMPMIPPRREWCTFDF